MTLQRSNHRVMIDTPLFLSHYTDIIGDFNPREKLKKTAMTNGPSTWSSFYLRDLVFLETPREEPVVVLLQLCCINKRWGDSKGVAISFHVSKLLLDEHTPEAEGFCIKYLHMRASAAPSSGQPSSSSGLSADDGKEVRFTWIIAELSTSKEDKLAPKSSPAEITRLVGWDLLFKIDHTSISPAGGGTVYSINMISENHSKIQKHKGSDGLESEILIWIYCLIHGMLSSQMCF